VVGGSGRCVLGKGNKPSVVEAIEVLRQEKESIPLIFFDLLMPGRDGFSFLNYLLKQHRHPVKVIALTAIKDEEIQKKFFSYSSKNLKTIEYIEKPFSKSHIIQSVKNSLNDLNASNNTPKNNIDPATATDKQKPTHPLPKTEQPEQQQHTSTLGEITRLEQKLDELLTKRPTFLITLAQDLLRLLFIAFLLALALKFGLFEALLPLLTNVSS